MGGKRVYPWVLGALLFAGSPPRAAAYITNPVATLGALCESTYITEVRVEKVSKELGVVVYRKVNDLKGKYPRDTIRHVFDLKNTPAHKGTGDVPVRPDADDWGHALAWAEVGKTAVVFALKYDPYGDFGHTYLDGCWYATMCPKRDWDLWYCIYADPKLLTRWHCGSPAHLAGAVEEIVAGKEAVVPVQGGGTKKELRDGKAKITGLKAGKALTSYDATRDTAPWPKEPATPLPAAAAKAWAAAGCETGWVRVNSFDDADFFPEPGRRKGDLPAVRARTPKGAPPAAPPDPGVPFALDLRGTTVTDTTLKNLTALKNLRVLLLKGTPTTDAGVAELRKALPECKVLR